MAVEELDSSSRPLEWLAMLRRPAFRVKGALDVEYVTGGHPYQDPKESEMTKNMEENAEKDFNTSVPETQDGIDGERSGFLNHFKDMWSETVGAYATDDGTTRNLFSRFVDFGTLSKDEAKKLFAEASEKIEKNRVEFDSRIDEQIRKATARFTPAHIEEMKKLNEQLSDIEDRISVLEGEHN